VTGDLRRIRAYLETHRDRHLARLQTLLRQPSVSVDGEGVEACARLLVVAGAFNGSRVPRTAPVVRAAETLFASRGLEVVWWPMTGGGGPWSIFAEEFGMPVLRDVGLGHGRASATDEYLVIDGAGSVGGMVDMAVSHAEFMARMGGD
jgi:acetylornithine deacetylase/succinyl-diaminopimelate desuccinylase-like protein